VTDRDDLLALLRRFGLEPDGLADPHEVVLRGETGGAVGVDWASATFRFDASGAFRELSLQGD
jgi:hypothetical protein